MTSNKNLVTIQEAKVVTSSLQVAQTFGKEHKNVLRDIQNLAAQNSATKSYFVEIQYENRGKWYPMYIINRDGFTLLAMGFTGKKALQFKIDYINAFNRMEEYIKQQTQVPAYPTLPKRKATGKRVETYLPNYDVLRLQTAAYQAGYSSVYSLLQKMIYDFLENPYSNPYGMIRILEKERDHYKSVRDERNQFMEYTLPLIQQMNQTIDEERALRKRAEQKLKQIKAISV